MALDNFILGTVLEPTFTELKKDNNNQWIATNNVFTLDTLKIANISEEGPEKTARGGINNRILARHGKTVRLEMEDAVGNVAALNYLLGAKIKAEKVNNEYVIENNVTTINIKVKKNQKTIILPNPVIVDALSGKVHVSQSFTIKKGTTDINYTAGEGRDITLLISLNTAPSENETYTISYKFIENAYFSVSDRFPSRFKIEGKTYGIKKDGTKQFLDFTFHNFLPDGLLNLTMESEGDFGVIEIGGELFPDCNWVFYEIKEGTNPTNCN